MLSKLHRPGNRAPVHMHIKDAQKDAHPQPSSPAVVSTHSASVTTPSPGDTISPGPVGIVRVRIAEEPEKKASANTTGGISRNQASLSETHSTARNYQEVQDPYQPAVTNHSPTFIIRGPRVPHDPRTRRSRARLSWGYSLPIPNRRGAPSHRHRVLHRIRHSTHGLRPNHH